MANDRTHTAPARGEQPRRRGWDRRRDLGRRIIRDRRREAIAVAVERRKAADRRTGNQRRTGAERRTPPNAGVQYFER